MRTGITTAAPDDLKPLLEDPNRRYLVAVQLKEDEVLTFFKCLPWAQVIILPDNTYYVRD